MERWSEEVLRLEEMLVTLERQKHQCRWFLKIGAVLALPKKDRDALIDYLETR